MGDLDLTLGGHEGFVELCALYPTGSLSGPELRSLRAHLEGCQDCRALLAENSRFHGAAISLVLNEGADAASEGSLTSVESKEKLFDAITKSESELSASTPAAYSAEAISLESPRRPVRSVRSRIAVPVLATAALLLIGLTATLTYVAGVRRGAQQTRVKRDAASQEPPTIISAPADGGKAALESQQSALAEQIQQRDAKIDQLSREITQLASQVASLKNQLEQANASEQRAKSESEQAQMLQSATAASRESLQTQLDASQSALGTLQTKLQRALDQRTSDLMHTATLQQKIDELGTTVHEKDVRLEEQQTLLSSDRDIRELMGARDLFIADVFDIARDGKAKSPFGRVFYTKNKSLIFYAFDLDKQQDARGKQDVAFQVWGLNDADKHHPLNLGIFYVDNQANRRWALRYDDPAVLERINAVFVTVEPSGGSAKPSGKQLLYAYLEAQPNHP